MTRGVFEIIISIQFHRLFTKDMQNYNIKLYKNSEFLIFQNYIFAVYFQDFF